MRAVTASGLATVLTNAAGALLYGRFAYAQLTSFAREPRASVLLVVLVETLFSVFFLIRSRAQATSRAALDWVAAAGGTFAPLLLRPVPGAPDVAIGQALQLAGAALAFLGIGALNRSVALVPSYRGLKRSGPYRWVRHPLYSAYTLGNVGYLISHPSWGNGVLVAAAIGFALLRIHAEERFLSRFPEYVEYGQRTRWRLIPFVF
jgi:protein-S-isoprenylcysteine O-methyltransferase Ste14